jgi:hypothetical protein
MLRQLLSAADPVHHPGRAPRLTAIVLRSRYVRQRQAQAALRPPQPPPNAVDVTADAAITAVIGAGRYTLKERAIIRCIAAAQPDLPLTPEWISMCLDQARALGEL